MLLSFPDSRSLQPPQPARRRPVPRKGHKKSRLGCATCKRRKVKCDEAAPQCGQCCRLGLSCEFKSNTGEISSSSILALRNEQRVTKLDPPLSTSPTQFDRHNLRFFSHFILSAYPPLPLAGQIVWEHVCQMSHEFDFLMHSMLGLGASHLSIIVSNDCSGYAEASLKHRVAAITGFNKFLSYTHTTAADADAALGTILALTFQSSHMPDGLTDFLTMVRGCYLIPCTQQFSSSFEGSRFSAFLQGSYQQNLVALIESQNPQRYLDMTIAKDFRASTDRLAPMCRSIIDVEYLALLQRIVSTAAMDPVTGHVEHLKVYDKLGSMTKKEFDSFSEPTNHMARLIIIHILVLDVVMSRRVVEEKGPRGLITASKAMVPVWIEKITKNLPEEYRHYAYWALGFVKSLDFSRHMEDIVWGPVDRVNKVIEIDSSK